jgi:hypothetical protein
MSGAGGFTPDSAIWKVSREWVLLLGGALPNARSAERSLAA